MEEWLITLICQVGCEQGISEHATSALLVEKLDGHQGVSCQESKASCKESEAEIAGTNAKPIINLGCVHCL